MISLESYPAFRVAQMNWERLTRNPDYQNDTRRVTPEPLAKLAKTFDGVIDATARWQAEMLRTSGASVNAMNAVGPQLASMLDWILTTYFARGEEYPEGVFKGPKGTRVHHEVPCWSDEHELYAHFTGSLRVRDYFLMLMTEAAMDRLRALEQGSGPASQYGFLSVWKWFMSWLAGENNRANFEREMILSDAREQIKLRESGRREIKALRESEKELRGEKPERFPTVAERRRGVYLREVGREES